MLKTKVNIEENEANFQKALSENDDNKMWECVFAACYNICKSIYSKRGFIAPEDELYDTAMNATCMTMRNVKERGVKPKKLSSYCYLRCLCYCNGYGSDKFKKKLEKVLSNINVNDCNIFEEVEL